MFISKSKKSPFYQLTYEVDGKRTTVSTKTTDLVKAQSFMSNFHVPIQKPPQIENTNSLSNFREEYLDYVSSSISKSYLKSIKLSFNQLQHFCCNPALSSISTRTLDKFITSAYCHSPNAASLYYRTLKAAFSKAVVWNYIPENPFKKFKAPKIVKSFPIFIGISELQNILNNTKCVYLKNLFITAFYTGMREGEIANMKWSWIDLQQNTITVKCSAAFSTKSKKERVIPICQTLRNLLTNQFPKVIDLDKNNFVFTNVKGLKLKEDFICKQFKKSVRIAGLDDDIHFHTLRHSFASMLVQRGVSLYVIKELLGHASIKTTEIYAHLLNQNLMDAVNLL